MKKTLLQRVSDGFTLAGFIITFAGIGERMGAEKILIKQYTPSSGVVTTEERKKIYLRANEEAGREFPFYFQLGRGMALSFAGLGLGYWDSRRERKKREWTAYAAREQSL